MSGVYIYSGSALSAIDDKGRLSIPAILRNNLIDSSDGRTLCLGSHENWDCLVGFGLSHKLEMNTEIDRREKVAIKKGKAFDRDAEGARKFHSLQDLSFDASGRFVMPGIMQAIGGLKDDVIFLGTGTRFCLWDPEILLETAADVPIDKRLIEFHLKEAGKKSGGKK